LVYLTHSVSCSYKRSVFGAALNCVAVMLSLFVLASVSSMSSLVVTLTSHRNYSYLTCAECCHLMTCISTDEVCDVAYFDINFFLLSCESRSAREPGYRVWYSDQATVERPRNRGSIPGRCETNGVPRAGWFGG